MWDKVNRQIKNELTKIRLAFRGVLGMVRSDTDIQLVQGSGLAGEQLQDNELFQHYGFTSNPLPGSMQIVLPIGGKTAHGIIIATEHGSYRLKGLASGEVAIYTDEGDSIVLNRGRVINVTTNTLNINAAQAVNINTEVINLNASQAVNAETPAVNASQEVVVAGSLAANGGMTAQSGAGGGPAILIDGTVQATQDVVAAGISLVNHPHRDSVGGTTSKPLPT